MFQLCLKLLLCKTTGPELFQCAQARPLANTVHILHGRICLIEIVQRFGVQQQYICIPQCTEVDRAVEYLKLVDAEIIIQVLAIPDPVPDVGIVVLEVKEEPYTWVKSGPRTSEESYKAVMASRGSRSPVVVRSW